MSGYGEEWLGNTDTTSTDIPIEPEVDNSGVLEIYRRMRALPDSMWWMGFESAFAHQSPHGGFASHGLGCWNIFCHCQLGQGVKLDGRNLPESSEEDTRRNIQGNAGNSSEGP